MEPRQIAWIQKFSARSSVMVHPIECFNWLIKQGSLRSILALFLTTCSFLDLIGETWHYGGTDLSLLSFVGKAPSSTRQVEVRLMREGQVLQVKSFNFPLKEEDEIQLPEVTAPEEGLVFRLQLAYVPGTNALSPSEDHPLRLFNTLSSQSRKAMPEVSSFLGAKVEADPLLGKLKIPYKRSHSLSHPQKGTLVIFGANFDLYPSLAEQLIGHAEAGTPVIVHGPISGFFPLFGEDRVSRCIYSTSAEILNKWPEATPLPVLDQRRFTPANKSGRPGLICQANATEGWSWIELSTKGEKVVICTWDLAGLAENRPEVDLIMRKLLQEK